ncbi:GTP cyclohydrolase II [Xenorhabdus sp. DI]|uniref:GTP cyclohydrolase II n=1 Tax=Xenorhabdus doucetiae TaxID=351671 RepID=UPI001986F9F0|nr:MULTISPECIES: GTP cyclohydrolase II [unclassified Xenorhabdus]MBD2784940.1 GTP cyclohydrolase II [Xenorhabdus sp. 3]MBD2789211.1 GTP cyclohydrolase II [Xenorhabdus sp. DI]
MVTCYVKNSVDIPILSEGHVGSFISFDGFTSPNEHIAIVIGEYQNKSPLVRIHSECLTGDIFGSHRCDCGAQLQEALKQMCEEGGILLYLRQEGRGIGLYAKLDAYSLQDKGFDTFEANKKLNFPEDGRDFSVAANMLTALGITNCRLMTNNPEKVMALQEHGILVDEVISTGVYMTKHNQQYLIAKANKKNHSIKLKLSA